MFILFSTGFVMRASWGCVFAHAPLQEFGNMLRKSTRKRTKRSEGKKICACWWTDLCVTMSACVPVYPVRLVSVCICVRKRINAWVADPRASPLYSAPV